MIKDRIVLSGIAIGLFITALVSAFPQNKVRPKDAASNLSYMASHAIANEPLWK